MSTARMALAQARHIEGELQYFCLFHLFASASVTFFLQFCSQGVLFAPECQRPLFLPLYWSTSSVLRSWPASAVERAQSSRSLLKCLFERFIDECLAIETSWVGESSLVDLVILILVQLEYGMHLGLTLISELCCFEPCVEVPSLVYALHWLHVNLCTLGSRQPHSLLSR